MPAFYRVIIPVYRIAGMMMAVCHEPVCFFVCSFVDGHKKIFPPLIKISIHGRAHCAHSENGSGYPQCKTVCVGKACRLSLYSRSGYGNLHQSAGMENGKEAFYLYQPE